MCIECMHPLMVCDCEVSGLVFAIRVAESFKSEDDN